MHSKFVNGLTGFEFNLITGTDERDSIRGTVGDDYIIAGAGKDFYIRGGDGCDAFEVNFGDDVVRIADFVLGEDVVVLTNETVLETATFRKSGERFDVVLEDGTLIRVNDVTEADIGDMFVFRDNAEPGTEDGGDTAASHDPLDVSSMNLIVGTSERDGISGTSDDDYIIAGGGKDFYVRGGAGKDTFEVNFGDDVVRIADFLVGSDVIALENREVLENATFKENGDRFDVILEDGTLIRVNDATVADVPDMFVFRSDADTLPVPNEPSTSAPSLKVVVFGGQSLSFGATGRDWVNTEAQFDNSLMLGFDNPANGARGWATDDVDPTTFNGFTPRFEVAQESPATGAMNVLANAHPDTDFVSLHYGQSGKSLDYIRENTLDALFQQLQLLKSEADAQGYEIDQIIELAWIQGQSGSSGDYSETLSAHQDEVEAAVQDILGEDYSVNLYASITRGFGGKVTTGEQFDAIMEDPDIHLGTTEVTFNSQYPANGNATTAHLSGQGYYMMGAQIGSRILSNMEGNLVEPIAVEAVRAVGNNVFQVDFSGVIGSLLYDPTVFSDDDFVGVPDNFGFDLYRISNGRLPGEIVSSRILDDNTIEFEYEGDLSGNVRLWVGRSESDGWLANGGGAGYGGTTLRDTGQLFTAVDPIDGLELETAELYEYVPQQHFDFFV